MDDSLHCTAPLNQTAAALLASAVAELFPGALIIGGEGTPERFFYDFSFPFAFQTDFLSLIEERMRLVIREKRAVKRLEMMPSNAAAMLRHLGQPLAAERLEGVERATAEMCQIGSFAVYSPNPFQEDLAIPCFKLLEGFPIAEGVIRIVGAAAQEKDVLKALSKQPPVSSRSHVQLGREMGMFEMLEEGLWMWLPRGELLRRRLIQLWEEEHAKQNFNLVSSPAAFLEGGITAAHRRYFLRSGAGKIAEIALVANPQRSDPALGLLAPGAHFVDLAHLFCPDEKLLEECISSLHFICKLPKILGFEFEIVLSASNEGTRKGRSKGLAVLKEALEKIGLPFTLERGFLPGAYAASVDVRIADALGRRWTGPYLRVSEMEIPGSALIRSAFGSLERIAALLLEKSGGWLPLPLAPEQVRILAIAGSGARYAERVREELEAQGFRAALESDGGALKERVYKAAAQRVPYVVLLGEREEKAKALTVRAYGANKEQTLSLDEFCMRLKSEMGSYTSELTN